MRLHLSIWFLSIEVCFAFYISLNPNKIYSLPALHIFNVIFCLLNHSLILTIVCKPQTGKKYIMIH